MSKHCGNRKNCCKEDEFIKSDTYEKCIYHAFYNENGRRYPHQYRINTHNFETYYNKLLSLENKVMNCKKFDEIYELFNACKIKGIGSLTVYDVALRVSWNYNIHPDFLYLHAGTKVGALNAGLIKKGDKKDKLTKNEIVEKCKWLENVEMYRIEDFLCIYKNDPCEKNLNIYLTSNQQK